MFIPKETIEEIQSKCDIVELVNAYIPLKKSGKSYKALSPFTSEKTPSFFVSPDKQIFHCFSTGRGGNVFTFLMEYEKIGFVEAVKILAEKVGVRIDPSDNQTSRRGVSSIREQLFNINDMAMKYFHRMLVHPTYGCQGKTYLQERYFSEAMIRKFQIGWAQDDWESLKKAAFKKAIPLSLLLKAGLVVKSDKSQSTYDRFRNRVIFPIQDVYNKVIGFGGRALGDANPKYLNSPETEVFNKGRHLYGLNLAKNAILDNDQAVIVEGYTDCIRLHSIGVDCAVATLGTALTKEHARLLQRYTRNILLIFDADVAGKNAMMRSLDVFLEEYISVKIFLLPEGHDPDSYFYEFGTLGFERIKDKAQDFFDFKIDTLRTHNKAVTLQSKIHIANEMFQSIEKLDNVIYQNELLRRLAQKLDIDMGAVETEFRFRQRRASKQRVHDLPEKTNLAQASHDIAEDLLIKALLHHPNLIETYRSALSQLSLTGGQKSIMEIMLACKEPAALMSAQIMNQLDDERWHHYLSRLAQEEMNSEAPEDIITDCMKRIRSKSVLTKKRELQEEMKRLESLGDFGSLQQHMKAYKSIVEEDAWELPL